MQGVSQANTARKPCATLVVPSLPALQGTHCRRAWMLPLLGLDIDVALLVKDKPWVVLPKTCC